jgi:hypothetical protein
MGYVVNELKADMASTFVVSPKGFLLSLCIKPVATRDVVDNHPPAFTVVMLMARCRVRTLGWSETRAFESASC